MITSWILQGNAKWAWGQSWEQGRHTFLGYLSPTEFEKQQVWKKAAHHKAHGGCNIHVWK